MLVCSQFTYMHPDTAFVVQSINQFYLGQNTQDRVQDHKRSLSVLALRIRYESSHETETE